MEYVIPRYKEILKNFFIILFFYMYLFQPPVINKSIYIVVELLILFTYVFFVDKKIIRIFIRKFKVEIFILYIIICYSIVRDILAGSEVYSFRFFAWAFQSFIFGFFIIYVIDKFNNWRENQLQIISLLYWTCFIASIFTLVLLTNKSFDTYYQTIQLDDFDQYADMAFRYRAYGISENLTFTYSYVMGFFAGYTLLVIRKNIFLIFPFLLFVLAIMFNARIGIVALLLFFIIILVQKKFSNIIITVVLALIVLAAVAIKYSDLTAMMVSNKEWALHFFYDISDSIFGTHYASTSEMDQLTNSFIIFPDTFFHWVFGNGESLFLKTGGGNSDIGYIIQLNYGGLLFLIQILVMMMFFSYRLCKTLTWRHWFVSIFICSIIILNFKGFIFAATPGGRILFFLYVFYIYMYPNKKLDAA